MSIINNGLLLAAEAAGGGGVPGQISRSLRFNAPDSAFLSRTPGSAGNRKTWTWSGWVKFSSFSNVRLFSAGTDGNNGSAIEMGSSGNPCLQVWNYISGYKTLRVTNTVFRDPSAWYHIVVSCTASTLKIYVNGVESSYSSSAGPDGSDWFFNATGSHNIGKTTWGGEYFNGYLADIHFIDGQALDPTSFTEVSATTGQLIPKAYTGSYGTNGFRLTFSDNSGTTSTTLGKDAAGSNNWTPNNFSVASGSGNDSLVDSPTSFGTNTGAGGEVRGNYCTLNPLAGNLAASPTPATFANGNLEVSYNRQSSGNPWVVGTVALPNSGKWYWEFTPTASSGTPPATNLGIASSDSNSANNFNGSGITYRTIYLYDGAKQKEYGVYSTYAATVAVDDVLGVAVDMDAGSIYFHRNGSWANGSGSFNQSFSGAVAAFTDLLSAGKTWLPLIGMAGQNSGTTVANFGQRPFAYTAPSGFKALCDTSLPAPTIAKPSTVMDVVLYTGTGSSLTPTSTLGFNPDLIWIKSRSAATDHALYDAVRGAQARLESNTTDAEVTSDGGVTAFNSAGFTVGTLAQVNTSSATYAAWAWDAGTSTVTNTQGSITSQVRANASAGFSIVSYTGTGSTATVGHGLNVAPSLIICKTRAAAVQWVVYHASLGKDAFLGLNTTDASITSANYWGSGVTSTVFGLQNLAGGNNNGSMIAYCFAPVAGYSAFGSYVGNGSADGPFVYTGFRPRWIMLKSNTNVDFGGSIVASSSWYIYDAARGSYNANGNILAANKSFSEENNATDVDFLSNGFKLRNTRNINPSGTDVYYAAFAESPFQYARAR